MGVYMLELDIKSGREYRLRRVDLKFTKSEYCLLSALRDRLQAIYPEGRITMSDYIRGCVFGKIEPKGILSEPKGIYKETKKMKRKKKKRR